MGVVIRYAKDAVTRVVERYVENKKNGITTYIVIPDGFNNRVFFGFLDMLRKENPKFQIDYDDVLIYDKAIAVLPKITSEEVIFFQLSITSAFQFNRMVHEIEETIGSIPEIIVGIIPKDYISAICRRYWNKIKNTSEIMPRSECIRCIDLASFEITYIPYGIYVGEEYAQSSTFVKVYGKCRNGNIYISPFPDINQPVVISSVIFSPLAYMDSIIIINEMQPETTELLYTEICSMAKKLQIEEMSKYLSLNRSIIEKRLIVLALLKLMAISSFTVLPLTDTISITESWLIENGNLPKPAAIDFLRKIPKNTSSEFLSFLKHSPFYKNPQSKLIPFDTNREISVYSELCFGLSLMSVINELDIETITVITCPGLSDYVKRKYLDYDGLNKIFDSINSVPSLFEYYGSLNEGFVFGALVEAICCGYCNIEYDSDFKIHFVISYMSRAIFYHLFAILSPAIMMLTKRESDSWWANNNVLSFIKEIDESEIPVYPFLNIPRKSFIKIMECIYKDLDKYIDRESGEKLMDIAIMYDDDYEEMRSMIIAYLIIAKKVVTGGV